MKFVFAAEGQRGCGGKLLFVLPDLLAHPGQFIPVRKPVLRVFLDLSGLNVASVVLIYVTHSHSTERAGRTGSKAIIPLKQLKLFPVHLPQCVLVKNLACKI